MKNKSTITKTKVSFTEKKVLCFKECIMFQSKVLYIKESNISKGKFYWSKTKC